MRRSKSLLIAFALGQAVQVICHAVSLNLWEYRQIPFCLAGGFLVFMALLAGCWINRETTEPKTYLDWAKIPGEPHGKR